MGILDEIVSRKRQKLRDVKSRVSVGELKSKISDARPKRDFRSAIECGPEGKIRLIAEIKKASPSKGLIRRDFDHISIAEIYEKKAVNAVSVLTEEDFFMGRLSFLPDIRKIVSRPVLRKDFIFDEYQIYESLAYEADAILLIAAILDRNQAAEYLALAEELGLSVLFEVHDFRELEIALAVNSNIIGINNRNLSTLEIDMNTTFALKREIPAGRIVVSESGIKTAQDVRKLQEAGIDAMLIGTSFMETVDTGKKIDEFMKKI